MTHISQVNLVIIGLYNELSPIQLVEAKICRNVMMSWNATRREWYLFLFNTNNYCDFGSTFY